MRACVEVPRVDMYVTSQHRGSHLHNSSGLCNLQDIFCAAVDRPKGIPERVMTSLADHIATAVIERFDTLKPRGKPQGREWTVLAGIVAEDAAVRSLGLSYCCRRRAVNCRLEARAARGYHSLPVFRLHKEILQITANVAVCTKYCNSTAPRQLYTLDSSYGSRAVDTALLIVHLNYYIATVREHAIT